LSVKERGSIPENGPILKGTRELIAVEEDGSKTRDLFFPFSRLTSRSVFIKIYAL